MDLYGRALVDIAIDLINGYLLCGHASSKVNFEVASFSEAGKGNDEKISISERKAMIARRSITRNAPKITFLTEFICSGDKSTFSDYPNIIGPVPAE